MKLDRADRCAAALLSWLIPHCVRIEVAGSVRRRKPDVNDIDLVVIPKITQEMDLFGNPQKRRNATWTEIDRRCTAEKWAVIRAGADIASFVARDVQVDVFWTTEETWGTVLLCRTGSKEHNIWFAKYAEARGGKWHPGAGLYKDGRVYAKSEEQLYEILGMSPIPPDKRELHCLPYAGIVRPTYA